MAANLNYHKINCNKLVFGLSPTAWQLIMNCTPDNLDPGNMGTVVIIEGSHKKYKSVAHSHRRFINDTNNDNQDTRYIGIALH